MKKYTKPALIACTDAELQDIIFAGASCPNCYACGTFNGGNC